MPKRCKMRLTVAGLSPVEPAMRQPVQRWRRRASTWRSRVQSASLMNVFHQRLSTMKRKSGILMDVHSTSRIDEIANRNQHLPFWSNGQPVERSQLGAQFRHVACTVRGPFEHKHRPNTRIAPNCPFSRLCIRHRAKPFLLITWSHHQANNTRPSQNRCPPLYRNHISRVPGHREQPTIFRCFPSDEYITVDAIGTDQFP